VHDLIGRIGGGGGGGGCGGGSARGRHPPRGRVIGGV